MKNEIHLHNLTDTIIYIFQKHFNDHDNIVIVTFAMIIM